MGPVFNTYIHLIHMCTSKTCLYMILCIYICINRYIYIYTHHTHAHTPLVVSDFAREQYHWDFARNRIFGVVSSLDLSMLASWWGSTWDWRWNPQFFSTTEPNRTHWAHMGATLHWPLHHSSCSQGPEQLSSATLSLEIYRLIGLAILHYNLYQQRWMDRMMRTSSR